jgi:hypothetical protein
MARDRKTSRSLVSRVANPEIGNNKIRSINAPDTGALMLFCEWPALLT